MSDLSDLRGLHLGDRVTCPMKGRRAPELAAGDLTKVLTKWLANETVEIASVCSHLELSQRNMIVGDWQVAKQHLAFTITTKFSFATHIPFLLCGLVHHDQALRVELGESQVEHHCVVASGFPRMHKTNLAKQ